MASKDDLVKADDKFKSYLRMILSMTTDCLMGGITFDTYMSNLRMALKNMDENRTYATNLRKLAEAEKESTDG
jgi:hypothetical protein